MKKIPVTEQNKQMKQSVSANSIPSSVAPGADAAQSEAEDPMAGLQADLDRFRDLALRTQADFENYKKRSAREKEEAIKYANRSLLERFVGIIDCAPATQAAATSRTVIAVNRTGTTPASGLFAKCPFSHSRLPR